jgi:hypothetical protein
MLLIPVERLQICTMIDDPPHPAAGGRRGNRTPDLMRVMHAL